MVKCWEYKLLFCSVLEHHTKPTYQTKSSTSYDWCGLDGHGMAGVRHKQTKPGIHNYCPGLNDKDIAEVRQHQTKPTRQTKPSLPDDWPGLDDHDMAGERSGESQTLFPTVLQHQTKPTWLFKWRLAALYRLRWLWKKGKVSSKRRKASW